MQVRACARSFPSSRADGNEAHGLTGQDKPCPEGVFATCKGDVHKVSPGARLPAGSSKGLGSQLGENPPPTRVSTAAGGPRAHPGLQSPGLALPRQLVFPKEEKECPLKISCLKSYSVLSMDYVNVQKILLLEC